MPAGRVAVVAPTYNEAANMPELVSRLFSLGIGDLRLYIVDDNSPDGTAEVARGLSGEHDGRIEVISRRAKLGLGTAYVTGFTRALEDGCDYVVQMDADLSHVPDHLPVMLRKLEGADVVVGSRYTEGGGSDPGWGLRRRLLSSFGNHVIRLVTGLRVKDVTSGFKAYTAVALSSLDMDSFRCKGFGFQSEVAFQCQSKGYVVLEHPIVFIDRTKGKSKMSMHIIIEAIWKLTLLRLRRL